MLNILFIGVLQPTIETIVRDLILNNSNYALCKQDLAIRPFPPLG
jgi:hypothetical protein